MISPTATVHHTNADQAAAWNGDEGAYWKAHAERFDAALQRYQRPFLTAAALRPDSHVLDIGCGTGSTTRSASRSPGGEALGVDLSASMIGLARNITDREQITNARFLCADAQVEPFDEGRFDVAISRTGAMFFGRPDEAFTNIARARPSGRLVLLTWQTLDRNEWLTTFATALTGRTPTAPPPTRPGPFSLSEPTEVRSLLESSGFRDVALESVVEPMYYGRDPDDVYEFVIGLLGWMLRDLTDTEAAIARERLRAALEHRTTPDGVLLGSAAWIITARRA